MVSCVHWLAHACPNSSAFRILYWQFSLLGWCQQLLNSYKLAAALPPAPFSPHPPLSFAPRPTQWKSCSVPSQNVQLPLDMLCIAGAGLEDCLTSLLQSHVRKLMCTLLKACAGLVYGSCYSTSLLD